MSLSKDIHQQKKENEAEGIEAIELDLFLQALFRFYGYDFREYAPESIKRRVETLLISRSLPHISSLIPLLAHNPSYKTEIINELAVSYSMLFRDPFVYQQIQQIIFPYLASFPRLNIWVAGCANGEEAYSLAILLNEAQLLDRTQIYATDINQKALDQAASGILNQPLDAKIATRYRLSSGQNSLLDYFNVEKKHYILKQSILSKIHFEKHNMAQQPSFISAELILCRNVLIYFNKKLQQHVVSNLRKSIIDKGFLVIGTQENMDGIAQKPDWLTIDRDAGIYQKPLQLGSIE